MLNDYHSNQRCVAALRIRQHLIPQKLFKYILVSDMNSSVLKSSIAECSRGRDVIKKVLQCTSLSTFEHVVLLFSKCTIFE